MAELPNILESTQVSLTLDGEDYTTTWPEFADALSRYDCDGGYCTTSLVNFGALDTFWLIFASVLVFFMQAGFLALEVGSVHTKNTKNILTKNVGDAIIGALSFYTLGYGFALVDGNSFIGDGGFVFSGSPFGDGSNGRQYDGAQYALWLFQWAFAATAATIVSGAVAERVTFISYFAYSLVLTIFVYPVVVHWGWSDAGWASAFREDRLFDVGVIDFAGSTVVHMTGGLAALVGCYLLGPRTGRFDGNGEPVSLPQQSVALQTLGTLILWVGWYGFNCGSTLTLSGNGADVAGKVAVTTTISAAISGLCTILWDKLFGNKIICPTVANNGILAGLVGITAGCSVVDPEGALVIGFVSSIIYFTGANFLLKMQIDDVVNCIPVHLFCGAWGTLAAGLFATEENYKMAYGDFGDATPCGLFYKCNGNSGKQFAANLVFVLAVTAWVGFCSVILFMTLKYFQVLRVSLEVEHVGLDKSEHGEHNYGGGPWAVEKPNVLPVGAFASAIDVQSGDEYQTASTPTNLKSQI